MDTQTDRLVRETPALAFMIMAACHSLDVSVPHVQHLSFPSHERTNVMSYFAVLQLYNVHTYDLHSSRQPLSSVACIAMHTLRMMPTQWAPIASRGCRLIVSYSDVLKAWQVCFAIVLMMWMSREQGYSIDRLISFYFLNVAHWTIKCKRDLGERLQECGRPSDGFHADYVICMNIYNHTYMCMVTINSMSMCNVPQYVCIPYNKVCESSMHGHDRGLLWWTNCQENEGVIIR